VLDVIRAVASDGSFDVSVTVRAKPAGGAIVEMWPKLPADYTAQSDAEAKPLQVVPILPNGKAAIRVDYTDVTKWRLVGLDGNVVVEGLADEADAVKRRDEYLRQLHMRLPSDAEFAEAAAAREAQAAEIAAKDAARSGRRGR